VCKMNLIPYLQLLQAWNGLAMSWMSFVEAKCITIIVALFDILYCLWAFSSFLHYIMVFKHDGNLVAKWHYDCQELTRNPQVHVLGQALGQVLVSIWQNIHVCNIKWWFYPWTFATCLFYLDSMWRL
jgi:hypothetical protein